MADEQTYDIAFSFDTTGSMYPCLAEVRRNLAAMVRRLFEDIPRLRIAVIAHGDYCDIRSSYLMKHVDFTRNEQALVDFVRDVGSTGGGDAPEAYEYVLRESKRLAWQANTMRALVMIGDAEPHERNYSGRPADIGAIHWPDEAESLFRDHGVSIFAIQCLDYGNVSARRFYADMARMTNGYHLKLNQFSSMKDVLLAVCYKQVGDEGVQNLENELLATNGGMSKNLRQIFDTMLGRAPAAGGGAASEAREEEEEEWRAGGAGGGRPAPAASSAVGADAAAPAPATEIEACNGAKFQVLSVDADTSIKEFVTRMGLAFKVGRGFYEFTKAETISDAKEIVLMNRATGELFEGAGARTLAGIGGAGGRKVALRENGTYRIFIQSTSANRKLIGGTGFLYEVDV
jgi:hypothetical protein